MAGITFQEAQMKACGEWGPFEKCRKSDYHTGPGHVPDEYDICKPKFDESMAKCKKFCAKTAVWGTNPHMNAEFHCLKWVDRNVTKEK